MPTQIAKALDGKLFRHLLTIENGLAFCRSLEDLRSFSFNAEGFSFKDFISRSNFRKIYELVFSGITETDLENIRETATNTANTIHDASLIKIKMGFAPSDTFITGIYTLISDAEYSDFLLDIDVTDTISGGAQCFIDGRYIDLTISSRLKNFFKDNKNKDVFANIL